MKVWLIKNLWINWKSINLYIRLPGTSNLVSKGVEIKESNDKTAKPVKNKKIDKTAKPVKNKKIKNEKNIK